VQQIEVSRVSCSIFWIIFLFVLGWWSCKTSIWDSAVSQTCRWILGRQNILCRNEVTVENGKAYQLHMYSTFMKSQMWHRVVEWMVCDVSKYCSAFISGVKQSKSSPLQCCEAVMAACLRRHGSVARLRTSHLPLLHE
jgi:hypothetical protein